MPHVIRPAVLADTGAIEQLVQSAYEPWASLIGRRPAPMDADYRGLIAAGRVYVTEGKGSGVPAGVIVLIPEPEALVVENVAVDPHLQGRGIGRLLLDFAEDEAHRLSLPAIRLYTHERMTGNIALYERLGYTHTGRESIGRGEYLIRMCKQLSTGPDD